MRNLAGLGPGAWGYGLAFVGGVEFSAVTHVAYLIPSSLQFLIKYTGYGPLGGKGARVRCAARGVVLSAVLYTPRCVVLSAVLLLAALCRAEALSWRVLSVLEYC